MDASYRWPPCWEKLGFQKLIEETLTVHRLPRAMTIYQFLLGMVLAIYVGFLRLKGMRGLLSSSKPTIYIEVNYASLAAAGSSAQELQSLLKDLEFDFYKSRPLPLHQCGCYPQVECEFRPSPNAGHSYTWISFRSRRKHLKAICLRAWRCVESVPTRTD